MSLHQISGAITFPFIKVYSLIWPDLKGLILALRVLYGICAFATAILLYRLLVRIIAPCTAVGGAALLLVYIPFGLPALSYNTIGMLGTIAGVSLLGHQVLNRNRADHNLRRSSFCLAALTGSLFALAAIAYPTLTLLPIGTLFVFALLFPCDRRWCGQVALWFGLSGCLFFTPILFGLGGINRLREMFTFMSRFSSSLGFTSKIYVAFHLLTTNSTFLTFCFLALGLGFLRRIWPNRKAAFLHMAGQIVLNGTWMGLKTTPVFYAPGNDQLFLLALATIPAIPWPNRTLSAEKRVLLGLGLVGLAGGTLMSYTASFSLINFSILGSLTVVAGLAVWQLSLADAPVLDRFLGSMWIWYSVALVGWTSFVFIYGERDATMDMLEIQIQKGPFAGLWTVPNTADLLQNVDNYVAFHSSYVRTVDSFGARPGIVLLTPFEIRSPMPFFLLDLYTQGANEDLKRHYSNPKNRPDLLFWYRDPPLDINRVQTDMVEKKYHEVSREGHLTVYRRIDEK